MFYECEICFKKFKTSFALNIHRRIHETVFPLMCTWCDTTFSDADYLRDHLTRYHSEIETFKENDHYFDILELCSIRGITGLILCPKCYESKLQERYKNNHMGMAGALSYVCILCCAGFMSRCSLEEHFDKIHNSVSNTCDHI